LFVGLHFLYAMSSATLVGVGRDAEYMAKAIEVRTLKQAQQCEGARPWRRRRKGRMRSLLHEFWVGLCSFET
jgi:hypothetical protein